METYNFKLMQHCVATTCYITMLQKFQGIVSCVSKQYKPNTCTSMAHTHDLVTSTHSIHMLQLLQGHVSIKDAHEMMMLIVMPCYDHAQMMHRCKAKHLGCYIGTSSKLFPHSLSHYFYS
jgi:hypothetical protein